MSENNEKAIAKPIPVGNRGIQATTLEDAFRMAKYAHASGLCPSGLNSPEKILIAAQTGMEAGLPFMTAVQSIYVVKGKPSWSGKAMKGLIFSKGICPRWEQGYSGEGDELHAWIKTERKDIAGIQETEFSINDAKVAGLLQEKDGEFLGYTRDGWSHATPWGQHTKKMLMWRCVGRHADDWFADITLNIPIKEVVVDTDWPDKTKKDHDTTPPDEPDSLLMQLEAPSEEPKESDKPTEPIDKPEPVVDKTEDIEEAEFEPIDDPDINPEPEDEKKPSELESRVRIDFIKLQEKQGNTDDMFAFEAFLEVHRPGHNADQLSDVDWQELGMVIEQKLSEFE